MTKKELEKQLNEVEWRLRKLECKFAEYNNPLTINEANKRDYIVRTNYLGKLTHKQLKEDFKKEIETTLLNLFKNVCNDILNYKFYNTELMVQTLEGFYTILKDYEKKQIVIDTYGNKECK